MAFVFSDRVKETFTTTGTGAVTTGGAPTSFKPFSMVCAVGDTFEYAAQAVDGAGAPTGDWEVGLGQYSGTDTITTVAVYTSSNSDAKVNWSTGTKQIWIGQSARRAAYARERLTGARTYYVSPSGSDSNDGLTVGTPFLTIQKAVDTAASIDNNGFDITISLAAGTYTGQTKFRTVTGSGKIIIEGAAHDLSSAVVSTGSLVNFYNYDGFYGTYQLQYMKLGSSGSANHINIYGAGTVLYQHIDFGACGNTHVIVGIGSLIQAIGDYTISGNANQHMAAYDAGQIRVQSLTLTFSGTPTFSGPFCAAARCGTVLATGLTFGGSFSGQRYSAAQNGIIETGTGNTGYFPGTVSGSTGSGGIYS